MTDWRTRILDRASSRWGRVGAGLSWTILLLVFGYALVYARPTITPPPPTQIVADWNWPLAWPSATPVGDRASGTRLSSPVPPPAPPPFYWVTTTHEARMPAAVPPNLPDLSVQWIARTPRYPRYCLDYSRGLPELCPGTANTRHFPLPGEAVTFTAQIVNQGLVATPAVSALWQVTPAAAAGENTSAAARQDIVTLPPLAPGATATLTLPWSWATARYTVSLLLDPSATLNETTRTNNTRADASDALYLDVLVHPLIDAAFARRSNLVGSWSFADWLQAQFAAMNRNLAASTYPAEPAGALDRVRVDVITVTEQVGGDLVSGALAFDGRWTFRVTPDDPDTPEDEAVQSAEQYAQTFAGAIDWGLVHELTHQLGMIDLYWLNVAGSYQNAAPDTDGRPLLTGFQWPHPGLMGGGNLGNHSWPLYSDHTVGALNRNQGYRRGYFGEYLFDIPNQNTLRVLDNRGQPLPAVPVAIYQTVAGSVPATPVITGVTDGNGRFTLPTRPLPQGGITTATGHTLAPNPFGAIDVVGWNGQLLAAVGAGDQRFYAWWPITDFNLASWNFGPNTYERTVSTHLPPAGAPVPPVSLDGRVDGGQVSLFWSSSPIPNLAAYRVYRGLEPDYYPFRLIATTTLPSLVDTAYATARYAVTVVDTAGRESGFSPIFRAQQTILPAASVVEPASGVRTVLDAHAGALLTQLPDDRWLGRQGSVHLGLSGAYALVRNAEGQLLSAVSRENQVKVLDSQLNLVNWFGRQGFVTSTLQWPTGIAQVGAPFTVTEQPTADGDTLGLAHFDTDLRLSGDLPLLASGVTQAPGRFGQGIDMSNNGRLLYRAQGRLAPAAGSLQLWVRPAWTWDDGQEHVFIEALQVNDGRTETSNPTREPFDGYRLRMAKAGWNGLYAWLTDGQLGKHDIALYADIGQWQPGQWHHLAVVWQPVDPGTSHHRLTLWVDGVQQDSQVLRRPLVGQPDVLSVGNSFAGDAPAQSVLDELHISRVARVGNSQATRLLVSQGEGHRIDVTDWLGNLVSQYGRRGAGPGQWAFPQSLVISPTWPAPPNPDPIPSTLSAPGSTNRYPLTTRSAEAEPPLAQVLVADRDNARIQVLDFDGQRLIWRANWNAGLVQPQGLAWLPGGQVLVSDRGDQKVKLLGADGRLLFAWSTPNDGHTGTFYLPMGVTYLPSGDVLVTDMGNRRVVRIARVRATCYDFNHSGSVDVADIQAIAAHWSQPYDPFFDVAPDGVIDVVDIMRVAARWEAAC